MEVFKLLRAKDCLKGEILAQAQDLKKDTEVEDYIGRIETMNKLADLYTKISKKDTKGYLEIAIPALVGLTEVILIINHEQVGYISSKALGFVIKGRV